MGYDSKNFCNNLISIDITSRQKKAEPGTVVVLQLSTASIYTTFGRFISHTHFTYATFPWSFL